jgi:hypothetical protein
MRTILSLSIICILIGISFSQGQIKYQIAVATNESSEVIKPETYKNLLS